jgi:hypothetical protein
MKQFNLYDTIISAMISKVILILTKNSDIRDWMILG